MASSCSLPLSILLFSLTIKLAESQITVGNNIFDSLDLLGCSQFKSIIRAAKFDFRYQGTSPTTIFVFNDTTYAAMPPSRISSLYKEKGPALYVQSFTVPRALETSSFSDARAVESDVSNDGYIFLKRRQMLSGNVASGTPGANRYFMNGAMITKANIKAGHHIIHIIDRVLDMPLKSNALYYAEEGNPQRVEFMFYKEFMQPLKSMAFDSVDNYRDQIEKALKGDQVTFFLPTDAAINEIPQQERSKLRENPRKLLEIIKLHIVPEQVLFTSTVNHNQPFNTQMSSGRVVFRKNFDREAVYVTGALKGGDGTVTARISPANITVKNGVIHQIDQVLGFVFKTAIEELEIDPVISSFKGFVKSGRTDLQNLLSASSGVTIFAPTDSAMHAISNVYENYMSNQTLINRVLELSMLKRGSTPLELTRSNFGYRSMLMFESMYNGRMIKIYSEGNDTWAEGGYVRARVVKPDIGVTNGLVHHIDAVFGIPTRDVTYTIFCNDWLRTTYDSMRFLELDEYLRDPHLNKNQQCSFRSGESSNPAGVINTIDPTKICGDSYYSCQFTMFVPNGTATDIFRRTREGIDMENDPRRWRWILRRLITRRKTIYLDRLAPGAPYRYIADNGEEVTIQVSQRDRFSSGQRQIIIMFEDARATVLRSDIGATNGVIHIIDSILFNQYDLSRDVSLAPSLDCSIYTLLLLMFFSFCLGRNP